jgi:hypothetical protein
MYLFAGFWSTGLVRASQGNGAFGGGASGVFSTYERE